MFLFPYSPDCLQDQGDRGESVKEEVGPYVGQRIPVLQKISCSFSVGSAADAECGWGAVKSIEQEGVLIRCKACSQRRLESRRSKILQLSLKEKKSEDPMVKCLLIYPDGPRLHCHWFAFYSLHEPMAVQLQCVIERAEKKVFPPIVS